jgi:hypothetical protein
LTSRRHRATPGQSRCGLEGACPKSATNRPRKRHGGGLSLWRTKRRDKPGSIEGLSGSGAAARPTGISLPFEGQPLQGLSGIRSLGNGELLTLTDNGFGNKLNSPDAMLMAHRVKVDFALGTVTPLKTVFLHDPDKLVPFRIVNEGTAKRYLTGADLDIESIQPIGNSYWFGDEFGPYLVRTDTEGKVTGFWETSLAGKPLKSPDHYSLTLPGTPDGKTAFQIRRSKGYEGMAQSPDGAKLYALLEGPAWDAAANAYEMQDGKAFLRILEFDVAAEKWIGRSVRYPLEQNTHSIGDFNMIDATRGMIIERDDGEGVPAKACQGAPKPDCFATPAKFKRIYLIDLGGFEDDKPVRKIGYIDLMDIADPDRKARAGGGDGKFDFAFFTIENVDKVDGEHIVVANDNNLPFSAGREVNKADNNEFILLRVPDFLKAR